MADDRRDDWHNSVDERLVNLTSAQKSADIDLDKIRNDWEELDRILSGDPTNNIEGLIESVNWLVKENNKFNRIFDKDYLGHGGLVSFITFVYERERERHDEKRESRGYKWGFWGMVLAALIGAVSLMLTNKEQIEKWWSHPIVYKPPAELLKQIEADKKRVHAKKRKMRKSKPMTAAEASGEPASAPVQ